MKEVYRKRNKEYIEWRSSFVEQFSKTFFGILPNFNAEKKFDKNIKKIKVAKKGNYKPSSYISKTLIINADISKNKHTIIHESMHAMSMVDKRRNFFATFQALLFRKHNDYMLEEGLTEYLCYCFEQREHAVNAILSVYGTQARLTSLLFKIFDSKVILDYYFNNNKAFINELNKHFPGGYFELIKMYREHKFSDNFFTETFCDKKSNNGEIKREFSNAMFETFKKQKTGPNNSIEDFKKNASLIFYFFREGLYAIKYEIERMEVFKKNATEEEKLNSQNTISFKYQNIKRQLSQFKNQVLKPEWIQLGINDDKLFDDIVTELLKKEFDATTIENMEIHDILAKSFEEEKTVSQQDSCYKGPENQEEVAPLKMGSEEEPHKTR